MMLVTGLSWASQRPRGPASLRWKEENSESRPLGAKGVGYTIGCLLSVGRRGTLPWSATSLHLCLAETGAQIPLFPSTRWRHLEEEENEGVFRRLERVVEGVW